MTTKVAQSPVSPDGRSLGSALLEAKLVTPEELGLALDKQRAGDPRRVGRILLEEGILDEEGLAMALSVHLNLPFIDLKRTRSGGAAAAVATVRSSQVQCKSVDSLSELSGHILDSGESWYPGWRQV